PRRWMPGRGSRGSSRVSYVSLRRAFPVGIRVVGGKVLYGAVQLLAVERDVVGAARFRPQNLIVGQLEHPVAPVVGVNFEETSAFVAARETILNTEDREGLVARAHEHAAVPGTAADIVGSVEIVVPPR